MDKLGALRKLFPLVFLLVATAASAQTSNGNGLASGLYLSSPPTLSNGQIHALSLDPNANLKVNVVAGGGSGGTSSSFGSAFPSTGTAAGFKDQSGNMAGALLDASDFLEVNCKAGCTSASDNTATGTLTALNNAITIQPVGNGTLEVDVRGTWNGTATFEASTDGTNFFAINAFPIASGSLSGAPTSTTTCAGTCTADFKIAAAGFNKIRARASTFSSGTATVSLQGSSGSNVGDFLFQGYGVAGTPAGGVLSVQGVSGGQALPVSGTVAVTQSTSPWIVAGGGTAGSPGTAVLTIQGVGSGTAVPISAASLPLPTNAAQETGGNLATLAGGVTSSVYQENLKQVNGVTTLTGTGATGTGAQRVTVAVDSATVAGSASLPAGSNIIGKVGIDQTTPGTTNGVQVNAALPAGGNDIGSVDQHGSPWGVQGTLTNNNAAPSTNNLGVLSVVPQVEQTPTSGDLNALSEDVTGHVRTTLTATGETGCTSETTAGGSTTCTITAGGSTFAYITAIDISCDPASGAPGSGHVTITGAHGGTIDLARITESQNSPGWAYVHTYVPPIVASAVNTNLVVNWPTITNGGICDVSARGIVQ